MRQWECTYTYAERRVLMLNSLNKKVNFIFNGKLMQISRFSVVGALNTLIDFIMFTVFNGLVGAGYTLSQVIGYSSGIINSFILNKKWTFGNKGNSGKTPKEFVKFIFVNLLSLTVTLVSMNLMVKDLGINVYVSKVIVTLIAQMINFIFYKVIVFN